MGNILTTRRLALREAVTADAPFMRALLNDAGFLANIGDRGVRSDQQAEAYIRERMMAVYARDGFGFYVVELRDSREPIGICGFVQRAGLSAPDLGFALLQGHVGRGHGLEAGSAMLRHGREVLGLGAILAIARPTNVASIGLLTRLGFEDRGLVELPGIDGTSRLMEVVAAAPMV